MEAESKKHNLYPSMTSSVSLARQETTVALLNESAVKQKTYKWKK